MATLYKKLKNNRLLIAIGMFSLTFTFIWFYFFIPYKSLLLLLPGLVTYCTAVPLGFIPTFQSAIHSVPPEKQGISSGIGFASRQLGGTVGFALIGVIILHKTTGISFNSFSIGSVYAEGYANSCLLIAGATFIGFICALFFIKD